MRKHMNFEVILISYNMDKFATSGIFNLFLKKFTPILTLSFWRLLNFCLDHHIQFIKILKAQKYREFPITYRMLLSCIGFWTTIVGITFHHLDQYQHEHFPTFFFFAPRKIRKNMHKHGQSSKFAKHLTQWVQKNFLYQIFFW